MAGYTQKQREWFHRVYNDECHFPLYSERLGWYLCRSGHDLQVHHVFPQGMWKVERHTDPNLASNGILLCARHHVGREYYGTLDWYNEVVEVVHPDITWALRQYGTLGKEAFNRVFQGRHDLEAHLQTYWNTDWDRALEMVVEETVPKYIHNHPEDPFPHKSR